MGVEELKSQKVGESKSRGVVESESLRVEELDQGTGFCNQDSVNSGTNSAINDFE